jgi:hypothetical protein
LTHAPSPLSALKCSPQDVLRQIVWSQGLHHV